MVARLLEDPEDVLHFDDETRLSTDCRATYYSKLWNCNQHLFIGCCCFFVQKAIFKVSSFVYLIRIICLETDLHWKKCFSYLYFFVLFPATMSTNSSIKKDFIDK